MITTSKDYKTERIVSLVVTHGCNLNCTYCFEQHKHIGKQFMTFDTAKEILIKEFNGFRQSQEDPKARLAIEFFGGEPLKNFPLIKQVYQWVKENDPGIPVMFQMTSNGTLFTPEILEWFTERKYDFRVVLSIDGDEDMHRSTRGISTEILPLEYIVRNWPNTYFKMTLSKDTISNYAKGIISLTEKGYRITSSLAEGIDWNQQDADIYRNQLLDIAEFYLNNPQYKIEQPFDMPFERLLYNVKVPPKNCGCATKTLTYDTDGTPYPCHLFIPIVRQNDEYKIDNHKIDFNDDSSLIDSDCLACPIAKLCRTCYGYNLLDRGDVKNRNMFKCKMLLTELQVISSFQIQYFMRRKDTLDKESIEKLDAVIKAYELVHQTDFLFA